MACASFLKFHPTLPKQGALVVTRHGPHDVPIDKRRQELSKEEKARQRHSVEVSNAGNYLHIQPSTLESLTRSAANANANRSRRKVAENTIKENIPTDKFSSESFGGYQTVSVLPPALKALVYLWEDLTTNCVQVINQQVIATSPVHSIKFLSRKSDKNQAGKSEKEKNSATNEKENKKSRKKKVSSRNYLGETNNK